MVNLASMVLPAPPSWYPGHMHHFTRMLPALLSRTDVVLELRDSRLPLTSINSSFEDVLHKWRYERQRIAGPFTSTSSTSISVAQGSPAVCERITVMSKRDLVPEWGIEVLTPALRDFQPAVDRLKKLAFSEGYAGKISRSTGHIYVVEPPAGRQEFASVDNIARESQRVSEELNVLVVGMPNVGKSTLLNALRNMGIPGPTAKALRTSAHPGLTRALSTRLKLSQDPLVYSFDSPGVMLPFLGKGELGAERGIKLALIAGIREGLYDEQALAAYLLFRLNLLNPTAPAYLSLLPRGTPPTDDLHTFLDLLAKRLGMLKRGGERDLDRATTWFVKWWRDEGCTLSANAPLVAPAPPAPPKQSATLLPTEYARTPAGYVQTGGWGFDFDWSIPGADLDGGQSAETLVQREMERAIDAYMQRTAEESASGGVSATQEKKRAKAAQRAKSAARVRARLARKAGGARRINTD